MNSKKEMYERRERAAGKRGANNRAIMLSAGLTEEQADAVVVLCEFRHWLHCNSESATHSESPEFERIGDECSVWNDCAESRIRERILNLFGSAPFERIDWDCDRDSKITDNISVSTARKFEEVNNQIESWLTRFDKKYSTSVCPHGVHRLIG